MPIQLTNFEELQDKFFGKKGTLERKEYEAEFKREINKLKLQRILKKLKRKNNRL